jgi:hypothetical protein
VRVGSIVKTRIEDSKPTPNSCPLQQRSDEQEVPAATQAIDFPPIASHVFFRCADGFACPISWSRYGFVGGALSAFRFVALIAAIVTNSSPRLCLEQEEEQQKEEKPQHEQHRQRNKAKSRTRRGEREEWRRERRGGGPRRTSDAGFGTHDLSSPVIFLAASFDR